MHLISSAFCLSGVSDWWRQDKVPYLSSIFGRERSDYILELCLSDDDILSVKLSNLSEPNLWI